VVLETGSHTSSPLPDKSASLATPSDSTTSDAVTTTTDSNAAPAVVELSEEIKRVMEAVSHVPLPTNEGNDYYTNFPYQASFVFLSTYLFVLSIKVFSSSAMRPPRPPTIFFDTLKTFSHLQAPLYLS
jgi:hypothetical protein